MGLSGDPLGPHGKMIKALWALNHRPLRISTGLKGNCDNSGTILSRWSSHWHPLITILAIKRGRWAALGAYRLSLFPSSRPAVARLNGLWEDIIHVHFTLIHYGLTIIDNRLKIMSLDDITLYAVFIFSCRPSTVAQHYKWADCRAAEGDLNLEFEVTDMGISPLISTPSRRVSDVGPRQDLMTDSG